MKTILQRIEQIAINEGIKITAFEKSIGASKGVLSRAINNGTDIQSKRLQSIVENYPQYSEAWLLTGRGSMLKEEQPKEQPKYDKKKPYILKEEAFERNYVIADCCKPIPGDESLGFINDDGNVVVHKRSCPIAMRLKSSFGERILNTEWSSHHSSFEATLEIKGIDSIGVLNTITRTISDDFNVNIIRLLIEAKDGVFEGRVKMKVHDVEDIQRMCVVLSKIKNIQSVARVAD